MAKHMDIFLVDLFSACNINVYLILLIITAAEHVNFKLIKINKFNNLDGRDKHCLLMSVDDLLANGLLCYSSSRNCTPGVILNNNTIPAKYWVILLANYADIYVSYFPKVKTLA